MSSYFARIVIFVLLWFLLSPSESPAAGLGLFDTVGNFDGTGASNGLDVLGGLDTFGGVLSQQMPGFSQISTTTSGTFGPPDFLRNFEKTWFGEQGDDSATVRGQHRRMRRERGGGLISVSTYIADTVVDDARYSDLKIKPDLWGVRIGYDLKLGRGGMSWLGLYYNYNNTYTKWGDINDWGRRFLVTNHLVGLCYTTFTGLSHLQFNLSVGYDDYDQNGIWGQDEDKNPVLLPSFTAEGMQVNFYGEFGIDLVLSDWAIKPFFGMEYNYLYIDDFSYASWTLTDGEENAHAFKSVLGIRVNKRFGHYVELQGRAAWVQQLLEDNAPIYTLNYSMVQGYTTPTQYLYDARQGRSFAWIGATVKFYPTDLMRIFLDYDLTLNACNVSHMGHLGLILKW